MSEQKLVIPSKSGESLNAILYKSSIEEEHKVPLLIMCHGFTGDKFEHGAFPNYYEISMRNDMIRRSSSIGRHMMHVSFKVKYCHKIFKYERVESVCRKIFLNTAKDLDIDIGFWR